MTEQARKFQLGDRVTKTKGSNWTGRVVGFYSTSLTPIGYAVESETEKGSVQIYPEQALRPFLPDPEPVKVDPLVEPVACPECGHAIGEESDLLTIAYMAGAYDERKARENAGQLRATPTRPDLAGIEGLVERLKAWADVTRSTGHFGLAEDLTEAAAILAALKEVDHD